MSSIVSIASLEQFAYSCAPQMAGSGPGYGRRPRRGGVSMDGHVGETESVKRTSQKWGGGTEKNITFRGMRMMLCLYRDLDPL